MSAIKQTQTIPLIMQTAKFPPSAIANKMHTVPFFLICSWRDDIAREHRCRNETQNYSSFSRDGAFFAALAAYYYTCMRVCARSARCCWQGHSGTNTFTYTHSPAPPLHSTTNSLDGRFGFSRLFGSPLAARSRRSRDGNNFPHIIYSLCTQHKAQSISRHSLGLFLDRFALVSQLWSPLCGHR